jgi:hypothetical protein
MLFTYDNLYQLLLAFHLIGLTMGLGGASISDFTFLGELRKRGQISAETVSRMKSFSQMVWVGITVLSLSGAGLLLISHGQDLSSPGFLAKMLIVAILVANGLFLNFYATPRLTTFSFTETYSPRSPAWRARKLTFIFGAISVTSWYGAFFIAMFKQLVVLPFVWYVAIYAAVLGFAIYSAIKMERILSRKHPAAFIQAPPESRPKESAASSPAPVAPTLAGPLQQASPSQAVSTQSQMASPPQNSTNPVVVPPQTLPANQPPNNQAIPQPDPENSRYVSTSDQTTQNDTPPPRNLGPS